MLLLGCGGAEGTPGPGTPESPKPEAGSTHRSPLEPEMSDDDHAAEGLIRFTATVRIDQEPGSKRLQGVYLARDDGESWVVAYRPHPWLVPFEGREVEVTGETYVPEGQALLATHFRLETLRLVDPLCGVDPIALGPITVLEGRLVARSGEPGTKSEGQGWTVLEVAGVDHELFNPSAVGEEDGAEIVVRARPVERSPVVTHRDGRWLWVLKAEAR